jgi:nucleotide-binding universal stress UspA family protein
MAAVPVPVAATEVTLKNVLFATDFSEGSRHALPYVRGIAKAFGATVHLCHIEAPFTRSSGLAAPRIFEAAGKDAAEHLSTLMHSPALQGLEVKMELASGGVRDEIARMVRNQNIDLLLAGTHGRTGLKKMLLGSVVEEIIRSANCPVITVGPGTPFRAEVPFQKILFPTNMTETSDKVLPHLLMLADKFGAQVTVLHVVEENEPLTADELALHESVYRAMVDSLQPRLAQFRPEFLIETGEAAPTILRVAEERNIDLIALGLKRAYVGGLQLRSSTAYKIMAAAHCPVLTLR